MLSQFDPFRFSADDFWETLSEVGSEEMTATVAALLASMSGTHDVLPMNSS